MKTIFNEKRLGSIRRQGFTLIELLVVIAVIALLMSVLMPALNNAKEQARVIICLANCKQIGTIIGVYRTENKDQVPIVMNRWAAERGANLPVKNLYLSLAFRNYDPLTESLPDTLSPEKTWGMQFGGRVGEYVENYMPDYYACPFVRGRATQANRINEGTVIVDGTEFTKEGFKGRFESFSTFMWGRLRNEDMTVYGCAPGLRPQYAALPWNCTSDNISTLGGQSFDLKNHMNWSKTPHFLNRFENGSQIPIKYSSLSEVTVAYCQMGESRDYNSALSAPNIIFNHKSHRKKGIGGSNAIFADAHAEWVRGDSIGWQ